MLRKMLMGKRDFARGIKRGSRAAGKKQAIANEY